MMITMMMVKARKIRKPQKKMITTLPGFKKMDVNECYNQDDNETDLVRWPSEN